MTQPNSRTIVHPGTGEEITFLKTSEENAGSYESIDVFLPFYLPEAKIRPHFHGKLEET